MSVYSCYMLVLLLLQYCPIALTVVVVIIIIIIISSRCIIKVDRWTAPHGRVMWYIYDIRRRSYTLFTPCDKTHFHAN